MHSFRDILIEVWEAVSANKVRSLLTMFGIAWGVGSLLLLVGLGEGFRSGQHKQMAQMGNDVIMMWGSNIPAVANQHTGMRPYKLTLQDAEAMRRDGAFRAVTAYLTRNDLKEVSQYASSSGLVLGVEANFASIRFVPLEEGRFINVADLAERRRVAVLGSKASELLFLGHPALGDWITLNGERFQVVGRVGKINRGNNNGDNQRVYIPLSVMQQDFAMKGENIPRDALSSIQYQPVVKGDSIPAVARAHQILGKMHGFPADNLDAFDEWDSIESAKLVNKIFDGMDVFLGGVGVVTLLLGAVGIVNIMLVAVTERTREIGLRKALGATNRSILTQFFLEGLLITGVSGGIGIVGAALFMSTLNHLIKGVQGFDPPRVVPWSAAAALLALTGCGIVAGLYPASKAAKLEPIEALRRE